MRLEQTSTSGPLTRQRMVSQASLVSNILGGPGTPGLDSLSYMRDLASIQREWLTFSREERELRVADWSGKLSETLEQAISVEIAARVYDPSTLEVRPLMFS